MCLAELETGQGRQCRGSEQYHHYNTCPQVHWRWVETNPDTLVDLPVRLSTAMGKAVTRSLEIGGGSDSPSSF